jgi:hypothetical protein
MSKGLFTTRYAPSSRAPFVTSGVPVRGHHGDGAVRPQPPYVGEQTQIARIGQAVVRVDGCDRDLQSS